MGVDGHLLFDTKIDGSGFNSGIKKLGGLAKSGLSVLGGAVAGVTAAMGAGVAAGVKYNAGIEQYQTSFEVMTGSADKAAEVIENLKKVGAETPFELNDLADVTQLLMNYGMTADEAQGKMMMLGDISQGSADKMQRIATAYGQMSSAGKVSLEDVKQMIEAGFNPLQEISESTGESMASLYDRISKGSISVDEITASMQRSTEEGGKYFQSMEKQSQTVSGMISTLKDNAQQLLGEVVQPITQSIGKELLPAAISAIDQLTNAFKTGGTKGLIKAGGQILTDLLLGIAKGLPGIISTAVQIITTMIDFLTANAPQLLSAGAEILNALLQGMLQLLPSIGAFVLQLFTLLYEQISSQLPVLLQKGYEILANLIDGFVAAIPEMLPKVLDFIQGIGEKLAEAAPVLLQKGYEILSKLVEGITTALPILISKVPKIITTFANIINDNFPKILAKGVQLIGQLAAGIVKAIPTLVANIPDIIEAVVAVFTAYNWATLGKNIITWLGKGIEAAKSFVLNAVKNIQSGAVNIIKNLPGTLSNIGKNAVSKLASSIASGISNIIGKAKSIVSGIKSAFTNIDWRSIGSNLISGIANGVIGAAGNLVNAAIDAVRSAWDAMTGWLDIASPSKKARDFLGKYWAQGIGVGFERYMPADDMVNSVDNAMNRVRDSVSAVESGAAIGGYSRQISKSVPYSSVSAQEPIDYERMGEEMKKAMDDMAVNMDGKPVGKIVAPTVNDELGKMSRRKT